MLVIICSLHTSVDRLFDEYQPDTAVRFNLVLYRPFPNAENVPVEGSYERQKDSGVLHVARARRPESVDGLQLRGLGNACPPLGCLRVVVRDTGGRR